MYGHRYFMEEEDVVLTFLSLIQCFKMKTTTKAIRLFHVEKACFIYINISGEDCFKLFFCVVNYFSSVYSVKRKKSIINQMTVCNRDMTSTNSCRP